LTFAEKQDKMTKNQIIGKEDKMLKKLIFILLLLPSILFAQETGKEDIWAPFRFFIGKWEGTGKGQASASKLETECSFILNQKYLELKGKISFEPAEKDKKGEVYEDLGIISYDLFRKKFVWRQFSAPGFVTQYVLDSLSSDNKTFVFLSESMENLPPSLKARSTFEILNENEFLQIFELASPGKEFAVVSESNVTRKK
jgi:hypothetical protein